MLHDICPKVTAHASPQISSRYRHTHCNSQCASLFVIHYKSIFSSLERTICAKNQQYFLNFANSDFTTFFYLFLLQNPFSFLFVSPIKTYIFVTCRKLFINRGQNIFVIYKKLPNKRYIPLIWKPLYVYAAY